MTAPEPARESHRRLDRLIAWFTIARGCLSLILGITLLLQLEGAGGSLATFMGLYWLSGGILTLAFQREIRRRGGRRMPLVAGAFGVVAGAAVLIQGFLRQDAPSAEETFLIVGVLVLGTGVTKLVSGMLADDDPIRQQSRESLFLGVLESALGVGLIVSRAAPSGLLILGTMAWAFTAGILLVGQGLRRRRRAIAQPVPQTP
jgi:uncharacterized membrane protein HdeD (DUF308 family)